MLASSSPATLVQRIIDSYELVKADSDYKRKTEWYFDTVDVVKIVQGYYAYEYGSHFDKEAFYSSRDLYVHCFASKGWLGMIRMLSPHEEEMLSKLDRLFKARYPDVPELALNELLPYLDLNAFMKKAGNHLDADEIKQYAKKLQKDAGPLFKISSVLELPTWFDRYKALMRENQTIKFEQDSYDPINLQKKDIYPTIWKAINEQRPYDRYEKNNHMDALALTVLHEKLKQAETDLSIPIPVFYSSHPVINRALKKMREQDPKLFAYSYRGKFYSIIRDAEYFILDQIINFERDIKPVEFFDEITNLKGEIEQIYQNYKLKTSLTGTQFKDFEDEIYTVVLNEFLHYVWLERNGIQNIAEGIENVIKFNENKKRVQKVIEKERKDFNKKFEKPIRISRLSTNLWRSIPESLRRFAREYKEYINQSGFDIFLTFGLIRFGLDKPKFEQIIQDKFRFILAAIQKIEHQTPLKNNNKNYPDQNAETDFIFEVSNMISEIISGVSSGEQDENLVSNLGLLWLLEELDLIVQICDNFEYRYDYYQVAFLHSNAITLHSTGSREMVIKITECVEKKMKEKPKHPYYNIWIGLAFTRFNMWHMQVGKPLFPELGEIDFTSPHYDNYIKSIKYLEDAIAYLSTGEDTDSAKRHRKTRKYHYALNNLIYYTTKGGTPEAFRTLGKYVDDFTAFEGTPNVWQNRFYDTLAWYYYRNALLCLDEKDLDMFKYYVELAEKKNTIALERPYSKRDQGIYENLKERIGRTKAENAAVFKES